ncbi:hypothetical protein ACJ70E_06500 [Pseudomonas plecoglossicida]|uniref:hypothetical protein n=1 Tax=Pseudomonas plecoglossicida TaxID=70775 RepID=UPI00397765B0
MKRTLVTLWVTFGLLVAQAAQAADVTLALRYRGETRQFENLTPRAAAACAQRPALCDKPLQGVVQLEASYEKRVDGEQADGFYLARPSQPGILYLAREGSAEQTRVEIEITHMGGTVTRLDGGPELPAQPGLQNSGCQAVLAAGAGRPLLWAVPANGCGLSLPPGDIGRYRVSNLLLGYRLKMPAPASLAAGRYRGRIQYSLGPDRAIGLGSSRSVTALDSDSVVFHIELEVLHDLDVRFGGGAERVVLQPRPGWERYAGRHGLPAKLEQDLPFTLASTGPFKVWAACASSTGADCPLHSANGDRTPLYLAVSLSGALYRGGAVNRQELSLGGQQDALAFDLPATGPVVGRGQLHFHVLPQGTSGTGRMKPGQFYAGAVTVVFDASL